MLQNTLVRYAIVVPALLAMIGFLPAVASASVVYNAVPDPLASNYPSQPFQAQQTNEFGDYIHLGGTDRQLTTVTVTMSDWALASTPANVAFCAASVSNCDATGFFWPITVNVYKNTLDVNGVPDTLLATKTVTTHIPWRPEADVACGNGGWSAPNCYGGFASNATFDLSSLNVTLPNDVIVGFVYNTQTYGPTPAGVDGPYNSLNIAVPPGNVATIGTDDSNNEVFWNTNTAGWYTDGGAGGVGTFRKDTNWTPYGTVALQINATAPACNVNASQSFVSDTGTTVDAHPAALLSFIHTAWDAVIAGASWIWSENPVADTTVDTTKVFTHNFTVVGTPLGASLMIATDNSYEVSVNGNPVGADIDGNNFQLGTQDVVAIPAGALVTGTNTLTISVKNFATPGDANPQNNPAGLLYKLTVNNNECLLPPPPPTNSNVHIFKYIDGVQATTLTANGNSFPMITPTYGNAPFTLGPNGWTTGDVAYEASTGPTPLGASYSAYEDTTGPLVGTSCDGIHPFALVGYSVGDTLVAAQNAAPTLTVPSFTNMQGEKYIIVRNVTCEVTPPIKVHILKYLNGQVATAISANNYQFPMTATWSALNIGAGSGLYVLGNNHGGAADQYGADTSPMSVPADYTTSEITDGTSNVVASLQACTPGKYYLDGYAQSSVSLADAAAQTPVPDAPVFSGITSDQYVVVFNKTCPTTGKLTVNKIAIGGNATFNLTGDNGIGAFTITTLANAGSAVFANLTPGTYHITEAAKTGWTQTDTDCNSVVVTAGGDAQCTVVNTNNKLLGAIIGTKYEDRDGDGKLYDGDHHRLSGWTIYIDKNTNGVLDAGDVSTVTDSRGNYRFVGLVAGTYVVREVQQTGWVQTVPSTGSYTVALSAGQIAKKKFFGNFKLGTISGMKYNDLNGNGRKNAGEVGLAGWTIQLKKGNVIVQTALTDANGNYSFTGLTAGTYTLSEVMQATWRQTDRPGSVRVHSGTVSVHDDFGNTQKPKAHKDNDRDDDNHGH